MARLSAADLRREASAAAAALAAAQRDADAAETQAAEDALDSFYGEINDTEGLTVDKVLEIGRHHGIPEETIRSITRQTISDIRADASERVRFQRELESRTEALALNTFYGEIVDYRDELTPEVVRILGRRNGVPESVIEQKMRMADADLRREAADAARERKARQTAAAEAAEAAFWDEAYYTRVAFDLLLTSEVVQMLGEKHGLPPERIVELSEEREDRLATMASRNRRIRAEEEDQSEDLFYGELNERFYSQGTRPSRDELYEIGQRTGMAPKALTALMEKSDRELEATVKAAAALAGQEAIVASEKAQNDVLMGFIGDYLVRDATVPNEEIQERMADVFPAEDIIGWMDKTSDDQWKLVSRHHTLGEWERQRIERGQAEAEQHKQQLGMSRYSNILSRWRDAPEAEIAKMQTQLRDMLERDVITPSMFNSIMNIDRERMGRFGVELATIDMFRDSLQASGLVDDDGFLDLQDGRRLTVDFMIAGIQERFMNAVNQGAKDPEGNLWHLAPQEGELRGTTELRGSAMAFLMHQIRLSEHTLDTRKPRIGFNWERGDELMQPWELPASGRDNRRYEKPLGSESSDQRLERAYRNNEYFRALHESGRIWSWDYDQSFDAWIVRYVEGGPIVRFE